MTIAQIIAPALTTALLWVSTVQAADSWLVAPDGNDATKCSMGPRPVALPTNHDTPACLSGRWTSLKS